LKRVSKDEATVVHEWFETRRNATLLTMRQVVNDHHHLFRKFSGRPGRAQSIAINSPLPDSVM
jgi:hypothetical protein